MSLFTMPSFNIGRSVSMPAMPNINPVVNLPGGGSVKLGSQPAAQMMPLPAAGAPASPLGDWRTSLGLTSNWGQVSQPVGSWFINPSPFIQSLTSVNNTIKNMQPVIPTNVTPTAKPATIPAYNWAPANPIKIATPPPVTFTLGNKK